MPPDAVSDTVQILEALSRRAAELAATLTSLDPSREDLAAFAGEVASVSGRLADAEDKLAFTGPGAELSSSRGICPSAVSRNSSASRPLPRNWLMPASCSRPMPPPRGRLGPTPASPKLSRSTGLRLSRSGSASSSKGWRPLTSLEPAAKAFALVRNINRKPSEGFSLAADDKGNVTACWLSGKLYANVSHDDGKTFAAQVEINPAYDPCNCCTTSAVYNTGGKLAVLYREETNNERDMFLVLWDQKKHPGVTDSHQQHLMED